MGNSNRKTAIMNKAKNFTTTRYHVGLAKVTFKKYVYRSIIDHDIVIIIPWSVTISHKPLTFFIMFNIHKQVYYTTPLILCKT